MYGKYKRLFSTPDFRHFEGCYEEILRDHLCLEFDEQQFLSETFSPRVDISGNCWKNILLGEVQSIGERKYFVI